MNSYYDGLLRRPYLPTYLYKGIMGGFAMALLVGILAYSFTFSALATWVSMGLVSIAFITAVVTHYKGFALDMMARRYRCYTWVAGLRLGTWQPLPSIAAVQVRPYQQRHALTLETWPVRLENRATKRTWQVLLSVDNSRVGIVAAYADEQKALHLAKQLADIINVPLIKHEKPVLKRA